MDEEEVMMTKSSSWLVWRFIILALGAFGVGARTVSADPIVVSAKYGIVDVNGKEYVVQNNVWGADTAQVLSVDPQSGAFTVVTSDHNLPTKERRLPTLRSSAAPIGETRRPTAASRSRSTR